MILSDREIRLLIERGRVGIDPMPGPEAWASTAVDLRLGRQIHRWKKFDHTPTLGQKPPKFCPTAAGFKTADMIRDHCDVITLSEDGTFDVASNSFVLGWTWETVRLPHDSRVAARVEGKSSLARLGLGIHVTAPTVHAGFGGKGNGLAIQLEIWNVGPIPIELKAGMPICQLIFEEVHEPISEVYLGR